KEVRIAYASILLEKRQLREAKQEFEQLLKLQTQQGLNLTESLYSLGIITLELGELDISESYFLRQLENSDKEQNLNSTYLSLAQVAGLRKDSDKADFWLSKVEKNEEKNALWFNVQMRRALLKAADGKIVEARQFLQNIAPEQVDEEVTILQTEAQIMKNAGQNLESFVLLSTAVREHSNNPNLIYDFAMAAESIQRYTEMEAALKHLINISPNNASAYNALGYSYADRNVQLDEALRLLEKANQLAPEDPFILDSLAWIKYRLKLIPEAEQILRSAYKMRQDAEITTHLGEILWVQNKQSEGKDLFLEAQKKDPNNALLKSTLQRLGITLTNPGVAPK
ncbi:MAG: tetratricopeptide repeat protein, partial [Undibacterium sp.]|nr:tetratricopeptide repeat protein [Undibacterium sp.]